MRHADGKREEQDPADPGDAIIAMLEEDIVLGRLHPRERLVEEELILRFGAKRHVVRAVLAELERMGLVERQPNRGAWVKFHSSQTVEDLYAVRELLEAEAARTIPLPGDPAAIARLTMIQASHDAASEALDHGAVFRANQDFHRYLFRMCGNRLLAEAVERYAQMSHGIRSHSLLDPARSSMARAEHHAMIDALRQGDREALVRLCREHLAPSKKAYLRAHAPQGAAKQENA